MRKRLMIAAAPLLLTGAVSVGPSCGKAIAGTQGQPCCYQANGMSYSSVYGADGKRKKPSSLPWYKCMIQAIEGVA